MFKVYCPCTNGIKFVEIFLLSIMLWVRLGDFPLCEHLTMSVCS